MQVHLRNLNITSDSETTEKSPQQEDLLQYKCILFFINLQLQTKGLMEISSFTFLFFKQDFQKFLVENSF